MNDGVAVEDGRGVARSYSAAVCWGTVALLFLLSIVSVIDRYVVVLLIGPIQRHLGLTDVEIGLLIGAAFAVPYAVFGVPIGWAVDRFQRRAVIVGGLAVWSVATMGTGLASSFAGLFAARSGVGMGEASLLPAQASLLSDLFPRQRLALVMSLSSMGLKVGQGVAFLVGGALTYFFAPEVVFAIPVLGSFLGWQVIFLIVGFAGLLFAPVIYLVPEPARSAISAEDAARGTGFLAYLSFFWAHRRFFLCHHLGFVFLIAMYNVVTSWTPAFLIRNFGWTESQTGAWLGVALLVAPILGMPLHGAIVDHLYRRGWKDIHVRYCIMVAAIGCPIGMAAYVMPMPQLTVLCVAACLLLLSCYASLPATTLLAVVPSSFKGKAVSLVMFCGTGGVVVGPLLVGSLTQYVFRNQVMVGYSVMISLAILAPIVCGFFAFALRPLRELAAKA
jgi:MFS family permease